MKTIQLTRYKMQRYFFSPKATLPYVVIAIFACITYSMAPLYVCSGYIMSGVFMFFLTAFVCMNVGASEETVEEQLLMLHGKNAFRYYLGRELSLIGINLVYTLVLTFVPLIINIVNKHRLFLRTLTGEDLVCGSLIIFGSGLAGIAIADLFHKRIMVDRKMAGILTVLLLIITVVIDAVIAKNHLPSFISIFFPPVMDPAYDFVRKDQFIIEKVVWYLVKMILYFAVYASGKICLFHRKKF